MLKIMSRIKTITFILVPVFVLGILCLLSFFPKENVQREIYSDKNYQLTKEQKIEKKGKYIYLQELKIKELIAEAQQ